MNDNNIDIEKLISHIDLYSYVNQYLEPDKINNSEAWYHCPFHDDYTPSMSVSIDKQVWYCFSCKSGGDVLSFCKKIHGVSTLKAINMLCEYANLKNTDITELKAPPDSLRVLKMLNRKHDKVTNFVRKPLKNDIMLMYEKRPIVEWLNEGISQEVLDKYQVRYCDLDNTIAFPIFDNDGNIINIKKRTLNKNYKKLKITKYINVYKVGKLDYLFGFALNKDKYDDYKDLILFESEKSVMKLESFGLYNGLAVSTSSISKEQAISLINTGKNIVIAMDKDVTLSHIRKNFQYLINFTNTYVMLDYDNLLDEKDAPIDKGIDTFMRLYSKRMKL